MPRTPEQYQAIREEKKRKIMDAALELFANEGFHATSISKIARAANISKGLLYNYFESKEQLLKEIAQKGFDEIYKNFDSNHNRTLTEAEFVLFIDKMFEIVVAQRQFWKLYYALFFQPSALELLMEQFKDKATDHIMLFVDYFTKQGFENPMDEIFFFSSIIKGAIMQYAFSPMKFDLNPIKKKLILMYAPNFATENNIK